MKTAKNTIEESAKQTAIKSLKQWLKPGSTVYTTVTHISRSGMQRHIKLFVAYKGEIINISWQVSKALGWPMPKDEGAVKVGGCGMDMCFHTVYSLSRILFPKGFIPARAGKRGRNGSDSNAIDVDGGYALEYKYL